MLSTREPNRVFSSVSSCDTNNFVINVAGHEAAKHRLLPPFYIMVHDERLTTVTTSQVVNRGRAPPVGNNASRPRLDKISVCE